MYENQKIAYMSGKRKVKQVGKVAWKNNEQCKWVQELFQTREDRALNISLWVKIFKLFIFTSIHRVKTGHFYKSNSARFIDRWFINGSWDTEWGRNKVIWSLSFSLFVFFEVTWCFEHLLENFFMFGRH